jgi:hypothetical protein
MYKVQYATCDVRRAICVAVSLVAASVPSDRHTIPLYFTSIPHIIPHKVLAIGTTLIFATTYFHHIFSPHSFSPFLLCLSVGIGLTLRVGKLRYEPPAETRAVAASAMLLVFRPATGAIFSTTLLLPERLLVISRHAATKASLRTAWKALFSEQEHANSICPWPAKAGASLLSSSGNGYGPPACTTSCHYGPGYGWVYYYTTAGGATCSRDAWADSRT